ncbi:hypothetical protein Tco_0000294 [Tanacetum coccineum]
MVTSRGIHHAKTPHTLRVVRKSHDHRYWLKPVLKPIAPPINRWQGLSDFEDVPNQDGGRVERNSEGERPSGLGANNNKVQGIDIPLLLAAHLGRSKNGQLLQSSMTSVHGGPQPLQS